VEVGKSEKIALELGARMRTRASLAKSLILLQDTTKLTVTYTETSNATLKLRPGIATHVPFLNQALVWCPYSPAEGKVSTLTKTVEYCQYQQPYY
jgi:hypothetical protein